MNTLSSCNCANKWGDIAPFVLRVVIGIVFAFHGYDKFVQGTPAVTAFLTSLGFPLATFFAIALIAVELVGGVMLILGLYTHWVAKLFIIVSAVAFATVHATHGFTIQNGGYEYILTLLAASISLMITGPGKYSLDAYFGCDTCYTKK
jgi:putative oxidoreductase